MFAEDIIRRFECRQAMLERERKESQGKLPSVRTQKGRWGTFRNNTGLKSIILSRGAGRKKFVVDYCENGERKYLGIFENLHSAVDCLCKSRNITPMQIEGMTQEGWDLIKRQPVIQNRTYKGGK